MLIEVPAHRHVLMIECAVAFGQKVATVWIEHHVHGFSELDQPVNQPLGPLYVDIVVPGAVDQQQMPLQPSAKWIADSA